jgi:methyl-accepting chemotaxis protein
MKVLQQLPLLWKVLLAPVIGALCFLVYLSYGFVVSSQNNARLDWVSQALFPTLEAATENVTLLDKLTETLTGAVVAGEKDQVNGTEQLAQKVRANFDKVQKLDASQAPAIKRLSAEFDAYYEAAKNLSLSMLSGKATDAAAIKAMGMALENYRSDLAHFRSTSNDRFVGTISSVSQAAHQALFVGVGLGVVVFALLLPGLVFWIATRLITRPIQRCAAVADAISRGALDNQIDIESSDETGWLLQAMKNMQEALQAFVRAQAEMAQEHNAGAIDYRLPAEQFPGTYGEMAQAVNAVVGSHIEAMFKMAEVIKRYAVGDFSIDMPALPGKQAQLTQNCAEAKRNLIAMQDQIVQLSEAAARGNFSVRGDAERFQNTFRDMVGYLNRLMEVCDSSLTDVARVLSAIARGDLTEQIASDYEGTFGRLKDDSNLTVEQLLKIVTEIRRATDAINTAAKEIAAGNTDLSHRTSEQASSLDETATSMQELTATVKQNAENARQANQLAIGASEVAVRGGQAVSQVVATMNSINDSARKIGDIIGVIEGIAFQTNILALNAAVEAARAGVHGRGFAVVASEVRSLALRSAVAAKEIKTLIAVSAENVEEGSKLVDAAGKTMEEIVESVKRVTDIMAEITAASGEQSAGIEQVNQAIAQMDQVTQQNAALVEQAAAAASSMEEQARNLSQSVAVFKLRDQRLPQQISNDGGSRPGTKSADQGLPASKFEPSASASVRGPRSAARVINLVRKKDDWEEF